MGKPLLLRLALLTIMLVHQEYKTNLHMLGLYTNVAIVTNMGMCHTFAIFEKALAMLNMFGYPRVHLQMRKDPNMFGFLKLTKLFVGVAKTRCG